ncbi:MAG: 3-oxoacyl-ACP reductase FabG [Planctomycetes bacterium]|nr:3-oxoacyl-ACP reductase FabG [Planctomycetota bacterium]
MKLEGKKALVTGGSTGIGKEVVKLFAREGADIAFTYIVDPSEAEALQNDIIRDFGRKAVAIRADVTSEESVRDMVAAAVAALGTIDILVCSAGILQRVAPIDTTFADWQRTMAVNLNGPFLCCQAVLPIMLERKSGRIINIASQVGQKGGPELVHYAASKAGVIGYTKSLAKAYSNRGITFNCVAPGPILTSMTTDNFADTLEADKKMLPLGRQGEAFEVAPSVLFLASEPDGNLYTGQTLGPNSGDVML